MSAPTIHARSEWTSRAARSVTRLSWPSIRVVDIHWPARAGMIPRDLDSIKRALVSWQRYHMDTQGWRDIAYNVAVDLNGDVWELRGWDAQDGGVAGRSDDVTILLVMGDKDTMTDAMKRSVLWAMGEFERRKGGALRRSYHGALSSTSCPGPEATRWARAGLPPPAITAQTPTITTKEDDMPTPTDLVSAMEAANPGFGWSGRNAAANNKAIGELLANVAALTEVVASDGDVSVNTIKTAVADALAEHTQQMAAIVESLRATVDGLSDRLDAEAREALTAALDRAREAVQA